MKFNELNANSFAYKTGKSKQIKKGGGVLFFNKGEMKPAPDMKGEIKMQGTNGKEIKIPLSAWWKETANGGKYLSLGLNWHREEINRWEQEMVDELLGEFSTKGSLK